MAPETTMQQRLRKIQEEEWYRSSPDMTWIRFRKAIARYIDVHDIGNSSRALGLVGLDSTPSGPQVWSASAGSDELQSGHSLYSIAPAATTYYLIGAVLRGARPNQGDEGVIPSGFDPLLPTWEEMRHGFGVWSAHTHHDKRPADRGASRSRATLPQIHPETHGF